MDSDTQFTLGITGCIVGFILLILGCVGVNKVSSSTEPQYALSWFSVVIGIILICVIAGLSGILGSALNVPGTFI